MLTSEETSSALASPADSIPDEPALIEAGRREQLDFAVLGQMFTESPREWPRSIRDLAEVRGSDRGWHDQLPNLYALLTLGQHAKLSIGHRRALLAAMADDIAWDRQPIEGMLPADRELVEQMVERARREE